MSDDLAVYDGPCVLVENGATHRTYRLAARVVGSVATTTAAALGPALHALYARALAAVSVDRTLGGLAQDVREDADDDTEGGGPTLALTIATDSAITGGGGPTGELTLALTIPFEQPDGASARRNLILQALADAVAANVPTATLCVAERACAALNAHVATALGAAVPRNPDRPVALPCTTQHDGDHVADHHEVGRTTYRRAVGFVCYAADEAALEAAAQALLASLRTADRLGGLAVDVEEATLDPDVIEAPYTGPGVACGIRADITYSTLPGDPYTEAG